MAGLRRLRWSGWWPWLPLAALLSHPPDLHAQYAGGQGRGDDMTESMFTPCEVLLPVELLYFKAACRQGLPLLEWATGSEHNSAVFVPERSTDAMGWEPIGQLDAAGHSMVTIAYAFVDEHPPLLEPLLYYRLRQRDNDGAEAMLPTVALWNCGGREQGLRTFPNPAGDVLWVHVPSLMEAHGLELADAAGRAVRRMPLAPTGPATVQFPLAGIAAGTYQLLLRDGRGNTIAGTRIVKQ